MLKRSCIEEGRCGICGLARGSEWKRKRARM